MKENEKVLIGHVGVDAGMVMITDPCYIDSVWERDTVPMDYRVYKNKVTGKLYQLGLWIKPGDLIYGATPFSNYEEVIEDGKTMNQLVEEGLVEKIEDPNKPVGEYSYRGACATTDNEASGGELNYKLGHSGAGVVVSSGYGDGHYPVYAEYIDEGMGRRIANITVDFMGTYTQESMKEMMGKE